MELIPFQPKQADTSESLRWASIKFTVFRSLTTWKRKLTIKQLYIEKDKHLYLFLGGYLHKKPKFT